ncbi:MFS transporter [soil metagenome]
MNNSPRRWYDLAILAVAQFMIVLDVSIVNVALPSLQRDLNLSIANLQGIVTAYTLAFGGFLLLGGRAADLFGRKKIFLIGLAGFTVVSLTIGIADSGSLMVPLRALQGLFAAFMSPAALSLVLSLFQDSRERSTALSVWAAVSAGGATAGLLIGGALTQYLNWRWNFFVNVPVGLIIFFTAYAMLPNSKPEDSAKSLDLPGAALATSGLMLLVYTLSHGNTWGWLSIHTLDFLYLSALLLIGFIINEAYAKQPLMPLSIFKIGNVGAANAMQLPITAGLFAMFFFLSLYIQSTLHYSPLLTGLAFLPFSIIVGITATLTPKLLRKISYKWVLSIAPLFLVVALFIFSQTTVTSSYWAILPGLIIMPIGMGMTFVSITIAATTGVPRNESGIASGLLNTSQQIGGSIGLAILSGIAATATAAASLTSSQAEAAVAGYHAAFHTGIFFAFGASLIAFLFIKVIPVQASDTPAIAAH